MSRYPAYKSTGLQWPKEVPAQWVAKKIKYLATIKGRIGFRGYNVTDIVGYGEGAITIGAKHISKNNEIDLSEPEFLTWEKYYESPEINVVAGQILVVQRGSLGKAALVRKDLGAATINPSILILKDLKANPEFLLLFFNSNLFAGFIEMISSATAVPMISQEQLGNLLLFIPSPIEQAEIVAYVQNETTRIATLIKAKKEMIILLREERTAFINNAVNGEGKGWERKKLKYLAQVRDEEISEASLKIAVENIESSTGKLVSMEDDKNYEGSLSAFKKGDTLFNKLRPYLHKVYFAKQDGGLYGELLVFYCLGELLPEFFFYKLFARDFVALVDSSTQGTKMPRANWDFISQIPLTYPKDKELQSQIVHQIQTEIARIDALISKIEEEIRLVNDYREAFISECVTGKKKVTA